MLLHDPFRDPFQKDDLIKAESKSEFSKLAEQEVDYLSKSTDYTSEVDGANLNPIYKRSGRKGATPAYSCTPTSFTFTRVSFTRNYVLHWPSQTDSSQILIPRAIVCPLDMRTISLP